METTPNVRGAHRQNEPLLPGSGAPFMCHAQRRSCGTGMAHSGELGVCSEVSLRLQAALLGDFWGSSALSGQAKACTPSGVAGGSNFELLSSGGPLGSSD